MQKLRLVRHAALSLREGVRFDWQLAASPGAFHNNNAGTDPGRVVA